MPQLLNGIKKKTTVKPLMTMMLHPGAKQRKCQLLCCISLWKGAFGEGSGELQRCGNFSLLREPLKGRIKQYANGYRNRREMGSSLESESTDKKVNELCVWFCTFRYKRHFEGQTLYTNIYNWPSSKTFRIVLIVQLKDSNISGYNDNNLLGRNADFQLLQSYPKN